MSRGRPFALRSVYCLASSFSDLVCGERGDDHRQWGLNVRRHGLVCADLLLPCCLISVKSGLILLSMIVFDQAV